MAGRGDCARGYCGLHHCAQRHGRNGRGYSSRGLFRGIRRRGSAAVLGQFEGTVECAGIRTAARYQAVVHIGSCQTVHPTGYFSPRMSEGPMEVSTRFANVCRKRCAGSFTMRTGRALLSCVRIILWIVNWALEDIGKH